MANTGYENELAGLNVSPDKQVEALAGQADDNDGYVEWDKADPMGQADASQCRVPSTELTQYMNMHHDLVQDLCMMLKNCANCAEEGGRPKDFCRPYTCMEIRQEDITEKGVTIDPYDYATNERIRAIAKSHGYIMVEVMDYDTVAALQFIKQEDYKA